MIGAQEAVAANPHWYHSIELAPGVLTPGQVDLRGVAPRVLPADLTRRRALDVGTFDGFWAFEMERRGAEVVAIDVESVDRAQWPPLNRPRLEARVREWDVALGRGFELAAECLGSRVRRVVCDVQDLDPDAIGGQVDLVFSGSILLHLRDPVGALERMRAVLASGGELRVLEPIALRETLLHPRRPVARFEALYSDFNWWLPNVAALRAWALAAGFASTRRIGLLHRPPAAPTMRAVYAALAVA